MQATAPIPQRDLARELKSAREARPKFREYTFVPGNPINDANGSSIPNFDIFFFGECCLKKNQNAPRPSDISTDVQYI